MKERVYQSKHPGENLPSIARGIDPNEKNHHTLNHSTGSRTTGELTDKIKSSELAEEAKEKLNDFAEGAKSLWNKVVEKFEGGDAKEKPE